MRYETIHITLGVVLCRIVLFCNGLSHGKILSDIPCSVLLGLRWNVSYNLNVYNTLATRKIKNKYPHVIFPCILIKILHATGLSIPFFDAPPFDCN